MQQAYKNAPSGIVYIFIANVKNTGEYLKGMIVVKNGQIRVNPGKNGRVDWQLNKQDLTALSSFDFHYNKSYL